MKNFEKVLKSIDFSRRDFEIFSDFLGEFYMKCGNYNKMPTMRETQVSSLGREDPLEKGMATHSSSLAWRIPWTEEPGGLRSTESQRVRHD